MAFSTVSVIAQHDCDEAEERLERAQEALKKELSDYRIAELLWYAALLSGSPFLERAARINLNRAAEQLEETRGEHLSALLDYLDCIYDDHTDDQGGADAGGCDSGGCSNA